MKKNILILAYYSYSDPVFQSAVLPYFLNFPSAKFHFLLLTFEHEAYSLEQSEIEKIESFLATHHISWQRSHWRSGSWKPLKKIVDFLSTILIATRLVRKNKIVAIYSEGFPGAILGYYISLLSHCKHIVHSFEPHADYMVEAGVWSNSSWETKVLRWHEMKVAHQATYIFTATQLMIQNLIQKGISREVLYRVPSCVDLDHFNFSLEARIQIRKQLGIDEQTPVLVYLGKFGGMYMEEEAFEFFKLCQDKLNAFILILSPDPIEKILRLATAHKMQEQKFIVKYLSRQDIPRYLSAADIGFVAVRQWSSKKYCSPIKTGEYLACGLLVIVPVGISDDVETLTNLGVCIPMKSVQKSSYLMVIDEWQASINKDNKDEVHTRARSYVEEDRSIEQYKILYAKLFETL